jgi:hypothetical protein
MANAFIAVSDDGTAASWNPGPRPARSLSCRSSSIWLLADAEGFRRDDLPPYLPHSSYQSTYLDFASPPSRDALEASHLQASGAASHSSTIARSSRPRGSRRPEGPALRADNNAIVGASTSSLAGAGSAHSRLPLGGASTTGGAIGTSDQSPPRPGAYGDGTFRTFAQTDSVRGNSVAASCSPTRAGRWPVHQGARRGLLSATQRPSRATPFVP